MDENEVHTNLLVNLSPNIFYKGKQMELIKGYVPHVLLVAQMVKFIVFGGASGVDMGIALGLCALVGFSEWLQNKRNRKLQDVVDIVNKQNEIIAKMAQEVAEQKTVIASIKMTSGFKKAL